MLSISPDQFVKPGSLEAEFTASPEEVGPAGAVERNRSADHGLPCNRLILDGIINRLLVGPMNPSQ